MSASFIQKWNRKPTSNCRLMVTKVINTSVRFTALHGKVAFKPTDVLLTPESEWCKTAGKRVHNRHVAYRQSRQAAIHLENSVSESGGLVVTIWLNTRKVLGSSLHWDFDYPVRDFSSFPQFLQEIAARTLWHIDPLLGNNSVNTFPRQHICRQQSDNFSC